MTAASRWILVVEDDRDIRETLIEALEGEGYEVVGAVDGSMPSSGCEERP